jgi:hypothetical protein
MRPKFIKETRQQFIERKVRENLFPDQCWIWTDSVSGGYGAFSYAPDPANPSLKRGEKAHRYAYRCRYGKWPIPLGRHTCDMPLCFNPAHIIPGTDADNARDRMERGRGVSLVGSANPGAKLNEELAFQLRKDSATMSQRQLASKYGVERKSIHRVLTGTHWTNVEMPIETRVKHPELAPRIGEANKGGGKLTVQKVREIRARVTSANTKALAQEYGVTTAMIWRVRTYRSWTSVE